MFDTYKSKSIFSALYCYMFHIVYIVCLRNCDICWCYFTRSGIFFIADLLGIDSVVEINKKKYNCVVHYTPRSTRVWGIQGSSCPSVHHTFGFRIIIKVPLNQIFHTLLCSIKYRLSLITVYFAFTVHELCLMSLFLLENRNFLGFRMIIKVWLNQIFSNFNTMLWTITDRLIAITVNFIFTVHELWPFFSQKIGTFQVSR